MKLKSGKTLVTRSFLPPKEEYQKYLDKIWDSNQLTNHGQFVQKLENKLKKQLVVDNLQLVTNGTVALQLALNSLNITSGEIITTPFSYVASVSAILWERCTPIFVDIEANTFCIDADKIEEAITKKTKAILAVHVFGYPCDVEKIEKIAKKHRLKVIYDGAHVFGAKYKGKSLLSYGDVSTCSFHATKLFHTIEGGCVIAKDKKVNEKIDLTKRFGHNFDKHLCLGLNAKTSEFNAAMGLCNLKYFKNILMNRKKIIDSYDKLLQGIVQRPLEPKELEYNHSYYPVVFRDETMALRVMKALEFDNIFPRRYFFPSLNTLPYLKKNQRCPISEDISKRILCLPIYVGLEDKNIKKICEIIKRNVSN
jgi:dTDP-4-amino-4,6-dideoxygalactose transaminase